jgi:hypothetical protein
VPSQQDFETKRRGRGEGVVAVELEEATHVGLCRFHDKTSPISNTL